jgi:hypothetical protein
MYFNKIYLSFFLAFFCLSAKSQDFLNKNLSQISDENSTKFSHIFNRLEKGIQIPGYYHVIICKFTKEAFEDSDITFMVFYISSNNKCFKYITSYASDKYLNKLEEHYNNSNLGLVTVKKNIMWLNDNKKYSIQILPNKLSNGQPTTSFILEVKKSDE